MIIIPCSGMFRDVPECSMFLVLSTADVCISPHLPRLQVIEIEVRKNSGIDVEEKFMREPNFAGEEFESK